MKLYISYYDNYISIVEGIYNNKKEKYNIKNAKFLSSEDVKIDSNDKYSLLKEALRLNISKSKRVVFSLNTRDVIIKSNHIPKVSPKDLDGIMNNEMYELMSLDYDQYTFSYEVTDEKIIDDKESLDVVIAAVLNDELEAILDIFKDFKLNVERIDTMSTSYNRLLKKIEYDDIMMLNVGSYGSSINIYKEDSLFIHDNIPVRINEQANYSVALALVDEIKGLMNFYSSRNFGKNVDTIVLVGESNKNNYIVESFKETFNSNIVVGIEELFDIEEDIQGDLQSHEISKACDILGSMCIPNDKKGYAYMNLLPLSLRNKQKKSELLKQGIVVVPIALGILAAPYIIFGAMDMKIKYDTNLAQSKLDEIAIQYKDIEDIDDKINKAKEEVGIYDMLSSKSVRWGQILNSIDKSIPYKADLTSIDAYYDSELVEGKSEKNQSEKTAAPKNINQENTDNTETTKEKTETPVYDQIPNVISIEGIASNPDKVGQFAYSLNKTNYFESVELKNSSEDEENGGYTFNIVLVLREGAVSGE